MSLSCECDYNRPDVFKTTYHKARKHHVCYECGSQIKPGETYEYIFGVWDGNSDSFHTCEKCADLRDSMTEIGYCMTFGNLKSDHAEYIGVEIGDEE